MMSWEQSINKRLQHNRYCRRNEIQDYAVFTSVVQFSNKERILQNITTGLVYTFKLPTKMDADSKSLVPKILHFMWIGSQVPEKYQENVIVGRNNNPALAVFHPNSK